MNILIRKSLSDGMAYDDILQELKICFDYGKRGEKTKRVKVKNKK